jgi:hypothetical protein
MNEQQLLSKKLILKALKNYRNLFNKAPNDEALELYSEILSESFEFKQVTWALSKLIKKGSPFFPACGEIFAQLTPKTETKEELAPKIAAEIFQLLRDFSQYDEGKMLEKASENARLVFLALGSTMDIRLSENIETTRAQLERLAKSVLSSKEAGIKIHELKQIGVEVPEMKKLSFGEFEQ